MEDIDAELDEVVSKLVDDGKVVKVGSFLALPKKYRGYWDKPFDAEGLFNRELFLVVSPHFGVSNNEMKFVDDDESHRLYRRNMLHMLKDYRGPMLIGIDFRGIDEKGNDYLAPCVDFLDTVKPEGPRLMYVIDSDTGHPIRPAGYENLAKEIKDTFRPQRIRFGGGALYLDENEDPKMGEGSLGMTIKEMKNYFSYSLEYIIDDRYCVLEK
jgi:hypothetical protein